MTTGTEWFPLCQRSSTSVEIGQSDYLYDSLNRRIRALESGQTAFFGYDGYNPLLKLAATGSVVSRRLYGRGLDAVIGDEIASQTRWFLRDQVGTSRDLLSSALSILDHYAFDSFGRMLGAV